MFVLKLWVIKNNWNWEYLCANNLTWVNDGRASCFFLSAEKAETAREEYLAQHGDDRPRVSVDDYDFQPEYFCALSEADDMGMMVMERDDLETLMADLHTHYAEDAAGCDEQSYAKDVYIYTVIDDVPVQICHTEISGDFSGEQSDYAQHNIMNKAQLGLR